MIENRLNNQPRKGSGSLLPVELFHKSLFCAAFSAWIGL